MKFLDAVIHEEAAARAAAPDVGAAAPDVAGAGAATPAQPLRTRQLLSRR